MSRAGRAPLFVEPAFQHYDWGDPGFIPDLLGLPAEDRPWAEAWFGAHPAAPSRVRCGDEDLGRLDELVQARGQDLLGERVAEAFGGLPYLVKILAAARPLSIQVHPNQDQARAGFAREDAAGVPRDASHRCYRDDQHKPEVLIALTRFQGLVGFRTPEDVARRLEGLPEIAELLPAFEPTVAGLRALVTAWLELDEDRVRPALAKLLDRLGERHQQTPFDSDDPEWWVLHAHQVLNAGGEPDRGLLFVLLLELVTLEPGQAVFLPAGVPHAYLEGAGVEVMASSDNVLRAGLTSKHVDPRALAAVVRFDAARPPILEAVPQEEGTEAIFPLPALEFDVRRVRLAPGAPVPRTAHGPELLVALPQDSATATRVTNDAGEVSLGRGQACLVPAGSDYQLETDGAATVFRVRVPGDERAGAFRGREVPRLAFGTSGLRGLVSEITDLEASVNTRGFVDALVADGEAVPGTPVLLGGDRRPSTEHILRAVVRAVRDAGLEPVYAGTLPTPALMYQATRNGWPSIMVTGSHIPFDRNGIKFNKPDGEVLKSDEPAILAAVERVRVREYGRDPEDSPFADDGTLRPDAAPTLPPVDPTARQAYRDRYRRAFGSDALAGLSIAFYEHSAVGREDVAEILRDLGAEVHAVGRSETFVAVDTEAISTASLATLEALVHEVRGRGVRLDAIVSTDGDSDRPLVAGVDADGRVRFVPGDVLGALVAEALGVDAAAVPISSNDLIEAYLEPRGVRVVRTRIGSPWVVAAMNELEGERRAGWEANGGFLTGSTFELAAGPLEPLPTRDAVLPVVAVLASAVRAGCRLDELVAALPPRFGRSGLLDQIEPAVSRAILGLLGAGDPEVRAVRFDGDAVHWTAVDGMERTATGARADRYRRAREAAAAHFTADEGFAAAASIDYLDGARIRFANDEIAHVRPSGNAPQLRIYALAASPDRADAIVAAALAEPQGILRRLAARAEEHAFVNAIERNIAAAHALFEAGEPPAVVATVCGSEGARRFWQRQLDLARETFRAEKAVSLHEDLPVNQAFGLLLLWQRLRPHLADGDGALAAFVFGEGSRAAPITETEGGQKPAIASFVATGTGAQRRYLSTVELALRYFAPVEAYLRRSGFDGLVVKWGDEVQIPTLDLTGTDPRLAGADVVRFVSVRPMTEDDAANKDWVGVDEDGRVTAFIPRRPLTEMEPLADRGLLQRRGETLYGGINLGSVALSRALLDGLLDEFGDEVNDPHGNRKQRPDLDPQLFTALTIAALEDPAAREAAWSGARDESKAIAELAANLPDVLARLRRVLEAFEARHGRKVSMRALDFGDQYWGDIGQHRQMYDFYMALCDPGANGRIARALAGLPKETDANGNRIGGDTKLGRQVRVRDSVLIDAHIGEGEVIGSVLVGTRCGRLEAHDAFDVQSTAAALSLASRSGSYKLVADEAVEVSEGERATTVCLPDRDLRLRVHEDTDLRDRATNYEAPILGNPAAFAELHAEVLAADPAEMDARREALRAEVEGKLRKR